MSANTPKPLALIRITDAIDVMERPLKALQAVEQLLHVEQRAPQFEGMPLLDRECLAWLFTVLSQDVERVLGAVKEAIECAQAG